VPCVSLRYASPLAVKYAATARSRLPPWGLVGRTLRECNHLGRAARQAKGVANKARNDLIGVGDQRLQRTRPMARSAFN
jgi:hypothetical protein